MQPAQFPAGGWVEGGELPPGSDQTYPRGTPVTFDTGSQELDEFGGGATVTNIKGVSVEGVEGGEAFNPSGNVNFASANRTNTFTAKLTDGSGNVQVPDAANINVQYGILKNGTGLGQWWSVDESDTSDVVVEIVGFDLEREIVFFKFIESAIQNN